MAPQNPDRIVTGGAWEMVRSLVSPGKEACSAGADGGSGKRSGSGTGADETHKSP